MQNKPIHTHTMKERTIVKMTATGLNTGFWSLCKAQPCWTTITNRLAHTCTHKTGHAVMRVRNYEAQTSQVSTRTRRSLQHTVLFTSACRPCAHPIHSLVLSREMTYSSKYVFLIIERIDVILARRCGTWGGCQFLVS